MQSTDRDRNWPLLPLDAWANTCATLPMWTQIVGRRLFQASRGRFRSKCSPEHLLWGAFALAVTRFSGRIRHATAPAQGTIWTVLWVSGLSTSRR